MTDGDQENTTNQRIDGLQELCVSQMKQTDSLRQTLELQTDSLRQTLERVLARLEAAPAPAPGQAATPMAPLNKESTSSASVRSSPGVEAEAQPKDDTKYVRKLEKGLAIPKFAGKADESVEDWYYLVQRAFKLGRTHPDLWVHLATSAFEGHAASWWRSSRRQLEDGTLDKVIEGLQARFEYEDRIGSVLNNLTSLKMENGYDAYIPNFEDLVAADNGNCSFVTLKHFYLKGLPGNDARGVSLQQPKTLDELYRVSRLVSRANHVAKSSNIKRESNKPTPATNMNPQRELSASEKKEDGTEPKKPGSQYQAHLTCSYSQCRRQGHTDTDCRTKMADIKAGICDANGKILRKEGNTSSSSNTRPYPRKGEQHSLEKEGELDSIELPYDATEDDSYILSMGAMVKRIADEVKGTAIEHDKEYIFRMASYQLGLNEARLNNAPYPQMPTMFPAAAQTTTLTSSGTDNVRAREIVPKEVRDAINAYPKLKRRTWHTWRKDFVGVLSSLMAEAEDLLVMEPKPVPFDKRLDRALVNTITLACQLDKASGIRPILDAKQWTSGRELFHELEAQLTRADSIHLCEAWDDFDTVTMGKDRNDHEPLKYLRSGKDVNQRLRRFLDIIEQFRPEIVYRKGSTNTAADAFSRATHGEPLTVSENSLGIMELSPLENDGTDASTTTEDEHPLGHLRPLVAQHKLAVEQAAQSEEPYHFSDNEWRKDEVIDNNNVTRRGPLSLDSLLLAADDLHHSYGHYGTPTTAAEVFRQLAVFLGCQVYCSRSRIGL